MAQTLNSDSEDAADEISYDEEYPEQTIDTSTDSESDGNEVSPELVNAVIQTESSGNPNAVGPNTKYGQAKGLMQLLDSTGEAQFQKLKSKGKVSGEYDPFDPEINTAVGTAELQDLKDKYGDDRLVAAAYNFGQGNVDKLISKHGNSYDDIANYLPDETKKYVPKVTGGAGRGAQSDDTQTGKLPEVDTASATPDAKGLASSLLTLTSAPEFDALSLPEKAAAIKNVYSAKKWGPQGSKIIEQVMTNYIDAAPSDERPNYAEIIGPAPFLEPGQNTEKILGAWKEDKIQGLIKDGINPSFLGSQLGTEIDKAISIEKDAYTARNRSTLGWAANRGGNIARDLIKGAASGVTKPIGGIVRLAGAEETANTIADLPEYLGKPANDYLYKTDENGYLKLNPDGTPIPHWQSDAAQMVGQVGSFLAGGFALKAAGLTAGAIKGSLFAANTLTIANDTFRSVYEETKGDTGKAYRAAMFSIPAAYVGTLGEAAVIAKWANPAISELSNFNKAKYLANVFTRNAVVGGATNAGLDAIVQAGEISQTGKPFDSGRSYVALGSGALISGLVGGIAASGDRPQSSIPVEPNPSTSKEGAAELRLKDIIPPEEKDSVEAILHQGTIPEQQQMVRELEKFQKNDAQELVLGIDDAKKIPPNLLDLYAVDVAADNEKAVLTKKSTYVPADSEELVTIDNLIGKLNKSLEADASPNSVEYLGAKKAKLQKQLAEQTESVNKATVEMTRQRGELLKEVEGKRALLDEQTDPILKKVAYSELKDSEAMLEAFDKANEPVVNLHEKIGAIQDSLDEVNAQLKNASKDTYVNDIKAKEANLKQLLQKRKVIANELKQKAIEEEKAAAAKPLEGAKPEKEVSIPGAKTLPLEDIIKASTPEVHHSEGVKVNDKYVLPVGQKWFVLDGKGDLLGKGHDYYADAKAAALGKTETIPAEAAFRPTAIRENTPRTAQGGVPSDEGSTAGAAYAGPIKESKTGERLRLGTRLSETVRDAFSGNNEATYFVKSHEKTSQGARDFIEEHGGIEGAVKEILSAPDELNSPERIVATQHLIEELNQAESAAIKAGDKGAADSYAALQVSLADKRIRMGTNTAQALDAMKLWAEFDPSTFIRGTKKALRDGAVVKAAAEKGMSPEEVSAKESKLKRTKASIEKENERPESEDKTRRLKKLKAEEENLTQDLEDIKRGQDTAEAALTEDDQANIKKLFKAAKGTGGSFQQGALAEAFRIRDNALKKIGANRSDTWFSFWQANQLSDPSTQGVNIIGNFSALAGSAASFLTTGVPRGKLDGFALIQGFADGALRQGFDAAMLELRGIKTYKPTVDKFEKVSGGFGRKDFMKTAPEWMKKTGLNNIGLVFRALSSADAFFYKTAQEGMAHFAAYNEGVAKGLKGESLKEYIADTLYNSPKEWDVAMAQAKEESQAIKETGLLPVNDRLTRQRAWEILERKRPDSIRTESINFASKNTFANTPEGVVGLVVKSLQNVAHYNFGTENHPVQPLKYFFPFLNVAGNILNSSLDYTAVGAYRAAFPKNISAIERRNILGKFIIGSVVSGAVAEIAGQYLDDKDPQFAIYANGPSNANERAQWTASGGRPYSIKYGDQYYRYLETPLGTLLAGLGSLYDNIRYNSNFDRANTVDAFNIIVGGAGTSFIQNSFLKSLGGFYNAIQGKNADGQPSKNALTDVLVVAPVKGFVPAAGLGRAISKLAEDPIDTKESFYAKLVSGIPFVQEVGTRPALNAFGEPVERTWEDRISAIGRFYSDRVEDPAWRFLAGGGYVIPDFGVTVATNSKVKAERSENLGAAFSDVLTPDERYEVIQRSGPLVKQVVQKYADKYAGLPYSDRVQEELGKEIKAIRNKVKKDIILGK